MFMDAFVETRSLKPRSATMKRGGVSVALGSMFLRYLSSCEVPDILDVHEVLAVLLFVKAAMALMKMRSLSVKVIGPEAVP